MQNGPDENGQSAAHSVSVESARTTREEVLVGPPGHSATVLLDDRIHRLSKDVAVLLAMALPWASADADIASRRMTRTVSRDSVGDMAYLAK